MDLHEVGVQPEGVKLLFDELDTGWAFVRSAAALAHTEGSARALEYAQSTHDAIKRLGRSTPLAPGERRWLDQGLKALQAAIHAVAQSPMPVRRG
jgi:hypothetical protein